MDMPTFKDYAMTEERYVERFGRGCNPIKYPDGAEPAFQFIGLVLGYCLEVDKPYQEIVLGELTDWLVARGFEAADLQQIQWAAQSPWEDDDEVRSRLR